MSSPTSAAAAAAASTAVTAPDMSYEFDCPQYKDFNAPEDEHADAWFGSPEEEEDPSASAEVFDGAAETAIPTAMETEQEAATITETEAKTVETETAAETAQNEQPASSPSSKTRVQQLVESFETKAVAAEPLVQQTKPVLSRASSIVKEAVAAIEEAAAAIPAAATETATAIEIDAPIASIEPAVQEEEKKESVEESKAEEEAIIASITAEAATAPEVEAAAEAAAETKEEQAEEDSLIAPTVDSPSFSTTNVTADEVVDEATSSRISQVFGHLRSSLPMLSAGCQTLMFKSEEFKATDEEAAALTEAFETAVSNSTPRIEAAEEEAEVNESSESITLQLAAQFAEVADSPITERTATAAVAAASSTSSAKRTPSASPSRRAVSSVHIDITATISSSSSSVPSFLRPTAGSISRAQAIAEAAAAAQAAAGHITRRPVAVARAAAQATAAAGSTPKINKKRAASQDRLDELARPRSAAKAPSIKKDGAEESHRPSTASKAHRRPSVSHAHSNAAAAAAAKLTVAQSPALVTRQRAKINHKPALKSTEEAELALIASEKESVAQTLRRNAAFFEKLTDPAVHHMSKEAQALPVRSAAAVTQPEEFSFHTAKRAKIAAHVDAAAAAAAAAASASKKDAHATETPRMGEPTKPVPFSFQTALRAPRRETILLSSEEQEIQALKSIKPFKATPLPEAILAAPAPLAASAKKSFQPTQATSPQLMTKERSKRKQEEEATAAAAAPASAAAPVAAAAAAQQSAAKKPRREVQPFHLATEERGRRATEVFQSQREAEQAQERAAHNFHARPVGATAAAVATAPIVAPVVPHCVELHREARAKFESKIHESEAAARAAREFHARPNPFTGAALAHDEALIVPAVKSDKPLTVPVTPALKSKARHAKREEFEESMREREAELKRLTDQRAEEEAERAARDLAKQRATMKPAVTALKARILEGPTFVPQPSKAPLTQPESPMLITKRRGNAAAAFRRMSTVMQDDEEAAAAGEDQENQIPSASADAPVEQQAMDEIAAKIAQPTEPLEGSLLGEVDSGLPLVAQFDAVAAE